MASQTYEEVLRFLIEAEGSEDVARLAKQLLSLGDAGEDSEGKVASLLEEMGKASGLTRTAEEFRALGTRILEMGQKYEATKGQITTLAEEMAQVENPTKRQEASLKRLTGELERTGTELDKARGTWRQQREVLEANGVATKRYADLQGQIAAKQDESADAMRAYAEEQLRARDAARSSADALEEQDEQFRKQAAASRIAREGLAAYRERAAAAAQESQRLATSANGLGGVFGRLRALAAPVLAFLSFRGAASGVKALAEVQQQAENSRRALAEMYGSQEAGNATFAKLEELALRNGLAIGSVVDQARRMKAFGIDPLNGSLQALVDQNAAAGGSMQDLEGKVLAIGQAWAKQKLQGEEILQLVERGVPVWDLLQKATGKNVEELQKLSSAGDLGRNTISALLKEIGEASAGAANRSLGTLSGLLTQVSARWLAFKQAIVDAGVGDYLRAQLSGLLGATGNMQAVAQRISAGIITAMEALKGFALQMAPLAGLIGNTALVIARNAEAVLNLAKVWAAFRLAEYAAVWARMAIGINAATTALTAQRAALVTTAATGGGAFAALAAGAGALAARVSAVATMMIRVARVASWPLAAITATALLTREYEKQMAIAVRLEAAQVKVRLMQRDGVQLGQQLQSLYEQYAGTIIESQDQIAAKTMEQARAYAFSLQSARTYYQGVVKEAVYAGRTVDVGVTTALRNIDAAAKATADRIKALDAELSRAANNGVTRFVDAAVNKFDELATEGKTAAEAIKGAFDGLDLTSTDGLQKAVAIVEQIGVRGTAAGKAVQEALIDALAKLAADELPKVGEAAATAFGSASADAKKLAEDVARVRFKKLGLDLDEVRTGFSAAGREVVEAFAGMVKDLDTLGLTAEQRSAAVAQAFDNALRQASTKAELQALKKALQDATNTGELGFAEFSARVTEVDAKLAALSDTAAKVPKDLEDGFKKVGNTIDDSTEKVADGLEKVGESSDEAADDVGKFDVALTGLNDNLLKAYFATNRYVNTIDTGIWSQAMNRVTADVNAQAESLARRNALLDEELSKYDPLTKAMEKLRAQYPYLEEAKLRATAEKQKRVDDEKQRATDEAKRLRQEAQRERDEAVKAAAQQGGGAPVTGSGQQPVPSQLARPMRAMGTIRLELPGAEPLEVVSDQEAANRFLQQVERSRSVSTRRRR